MSATFRHLSRMALGLSLVAAPAWAAGERISIVAPAGAEFGAQLAETLCISEECIPAEKVVTAHGPDWRRVQEARVDSVVEGRLVREAKGFFVELSVFSATGRLELRKMVPSSATGKLSVTELVGASSKVLRAIEFPNSASALAPSVERTGKDQERALDKEAKAKRRAKWAQMKKAGWGKSQPAKKVASRTLARRS